MPLSDEVHDDEDDERDAHEPAGSEAGTIGTRPKYVHQMFHRERVVGYEQPNIRVIYANPSLRCFVASSYSAALAEAELRDDLPSLLRMASPPRATHSPADANALAAAFPSMDTARDSASEVAKGPV